MCTSWTQAKIQVPKRRALGLRPMVLQEPDVSFRYEDLSGAAEGRRDGRLAAPGANLAAQAAAAPVDPPPDPCDGDSGGGQASQENESFSSSATSLETSLYRPLPKATRGRSSPNAGKGLFSQSGTYFSSIVRERRSTMAMRSQEAVAKRGRRLALRARPGRDSTDARTGRLGDVASFDP